MSSYIEISKLQSKAIMKLKDLTPVQANEVYQKAGTDPSKSSYVILKDTEEVVNMLYIKTLLDRVDSLISMHFPDLFYIRKNLRTDFTFRVQTMATSPGRLFINPKFYIELEEKEPVKAAMFVVIHEIYHNFFRHFDRAAKDPAKYNLSDPIIRMRCNMAMDYEINPLVESLWTQRLGSLGGLTSKIGGLISDEYTGMLWEYIYDELEKRGIPSSPDKNDQQQESGQQDGQDGNPEDGQDGSQSGAQGGQNSNPQDRDQDNGQGGNQQDGQQDSQDGGQQNRQGGQDGNQQDGQENSQGGQGGNQQDGAQQGSQGGQRGDQGDDGDAGDFSKMSGSEISDKLKNSDKAISSNSDSGNPSEHIMGQDDANRIDKEDGRDTRYTENAADRADKEIRDIMKNNKDIRKKLIDEVVDSPLYKDRKSRNFYEQSKKDKKGLGGKEATDEPGEVSGDSVAKTALAKKEVNMTWEDLLSDFFTTIVPSENTTRQINKYQLSTYKAIAHRQGSRMIVPMQTTRSYEAVGAVWILVDTSGSMWNYLSSSVTMIASLADQLINGLSGLVIIPVDTKVSQIQIWDESVLGEISDIYNSTDKDGLPMPFDGGGGTSFDGVMKFLDEGVFSDELDEDEISEKFFGGKPFNDIVRYYDSSNMYDGGEESDEGYNLMKSMPPCAVLLLTDTDVVSGALSEKALDRISHIDDERFYTFILGAKVSKHVPFGQTVLVPELDGNIKIIGRYGNKVSDEYL